MQTIFDKFICNSFISNSQNMVLCWEISVLLRQCIPKRMNKREILMFSLLYPKRQTGC